MLQDAPLSHRVRNLPTDNIQRNGDFYLKQANKQRRGEIQVGVSYLIKSTEEHPIKSMLLTFLFYILWKLLKSSELNLFLYDSLRQSSRSCMK